MDFLIETLALMTSGPLGWLIVLASLAGVAWALRMLWLGRTLRFVNFVLFTFVIGALAFFLAPGIDGGGHGSANYYLPLLVLFLGSWLVIVAALAALLGIPVGLIARARRAAHEEGQ